MTTTNELREEVWGPSPINAGAQFFPAFAVHNSADLVVTLLLGLYDHSDFLLDVDYSLTIGAAPIITLITPVVAGTKLRIRRLSSPRNDLSLTGTTLPIPETEETFDRFANYHADVLGELDRCLKLSDGEAILPSQGKIPIPEDRKGNFLKYDDTTGELTHTPKLDGVPGPQGVQGEGAKVSGITADSGGSATASTVDIVGTGVISTSGSGDTITIASANISGIDMFIADEGGATMGSVVTLGQAEGTLTTRVGDTITINSSPHVTHVAGSAPNPALDFSTERRLLHTDTVGAGSSYLADIVDWPSEYRSVEFELTNVEPNPALQSICKISLWDDTNGIILTDPLHFTGSFVSEILSGLDISSGSGFPIVTTATSIELRIDVGGGGLSNGITGSVKLTHVGNGMIYGIQKVQRILQIGSAITQNVRVSNEFNFAQITPLSPGVTHDGILIEMLHVGTGAQQLFTGTFTLWGHPL